MYNDTRTHNPTNVREVRKLNGWLASLSRFLPMLAEKARPFYMLLRKPEPYLWDEACEQACLAFKKTITTLLFLSWPKPGVSLLFYLSMAEEAINSALVQEDGKHQIPIYIVIRVLHDVEKRYQMTKKVALALITSARWSCSLLETSFWMSYSQFLLQLHKCGGP